MRKIIIALTLLVAGLMAAFAAPQANAQNYTDVKSIKPFSPEANFMSLPGYLRMRYYADTGQWISREAAVQAVADQGGFTGNGTGQ